MTIRIRNWSKHQHFKDRTPPWIKLYRDILDDPDWHAMSGDDAKLLVGLWLVASEDETRTGALPDVRRLAFRLRITESQLNQGLTNLSHWLERDDIAAISACHRDDAPETETETEGETEAAPDGADIPPPESKARAVTLKTYLAECEAAGVDAIPADDATFAYAESVGLPAEFVALAWSWFKDRYGESGTGSAKRYKDWRATFRNAVRDCWPKYWAIDGQGTYYLTTAGKQAKRARS